MKDVNRCILLKSRPKGKPTDENFKLITKEIPDIKNGEILIQTIYLSVDPYMRGRMRGVKTYADPFNVNEVLIGGVIGKVVDSKNPDFEIGDYVEGRLHWADYSVSDGSNVRKLNSEIAPLSTALGVVGMPGLTAYFGLLNIGQPKEEETVVVSGAAGAVGSVVGQIAKMKGCRVIGIAGSNQKVNYLLKELHFDHAINYKTDNVLQELKKACPKGVDIYFDNVGGEISDAVMKLINFQARIVLCGQISLYNSETPVIGPRVQGNLIHRSALMKGFIVNDYKEHHQKALEDLGRWVKEGKLKYRETIVEGLENAPKAFIGLFEGDNIGKQLVKVSDL